MKDDALNTSTVTFLPPIKKRKLLKSKAKPKIKTQPKKQKGFILTERGRLDI